MDVRFYEYGQEYLTLEEVQRKLRISRATLFRVKQRKDFPKVRIGRRVLIPSLQLNEWVRSINYQR